MTKKQTPRIPPGVDSLERDNLAISLRSVPAGPCPNCHHRRICSRYYLACRAFKSFVRNRHYHSTVVDMGTAAFEATREIYDLTMYNDWEDE